MHCQLAWAVTLPHLISHQGEQQIGRNMQHATTTEFSSGKYTNLRLIPGCDRNKQLTLLQALATETVLGIRRGCHDIRNRRRFQPTPHDVSVSQSSIRPSSEAEEVSQAALDPHSTSNRCRRRTIITAPASHGNTFLSYRFSPKRPVSMWTGRRNLSVLGSARLKDSFPESGPSPRPRGVARSRGALHPISSPYSLTWFLLMARLKTPLPPNGAAKK